VRLIQNPIANCEYADIIGGVPWLFGWQFLKHTVECRVKRINANQINSKLFEVRELQAMY